VTMTDDVVHDTVFQDTVVHPKANGTGRPRLMPDLVPMSFADMLRATPAFERERLRLPSWLLFPSVHARRDQASLGECERDRFRCAFQTVADSGALGKLVAIHREMHHQHGLQRFLPWHRVYLQVLEDALRAVHPDVTLPYWDWTKSAEQGIPGWLADFTPTLPVAAPATPAIVARAPQTGPDLATIASNVPAVMAASTFSSFTSGLESISGAVHVWVGGSMAMISTAPSDVLFWLHLANIDRLWWLWQQSNPNEHPTLVGSGASSAVMDPWSTSEPQTRSITALGYTYV
jgi:hypothetical protein